MTVRQYLKSRRAAKDAAERIRDCSSHPIITGCGGSSGEGALRMVWAYSWDARMAGAWRRIALTRGLAEEAAVYVRDADRGGRFIVTDMGEGLRAYALRSGDIQCFADGSPGIYEQNGRLFACTEHYRNDRHLLLTVSKEDLSGAVVRTLLASYRVASLKAEEVVA